MFGPKRVRSLTCSSLSLSLSLSTWFPGYALLTRSALFAGRVEVHFLPTRAAEEDDGKAGKDGKDNKDGDGKNEGEENGAKVCVDGDEGSTAGAAGDGDGDTVDGNAGDSDASDELDDIAKQFRQYEEA